MEIKRVSIIGLGALGILYGSKIAEGLPEGSLRIIADRDRISRYSREGIYCNEKKCEFHYVLPEEKVPEAYLLLVAVKYGGLQQALQEIKNHVGSNTIIMSLLNGITSEEIISSVYGAKKVIYCVAQGMDALRVKNHLHYTQAGTLCIGEWDRPAGERITAIKHFLEQMDISCEAVDNMPHKMWGKLLLNVGINQTAAVFEGGYGMLKEDNEARKMMIEAMNEVMKIAPHEGVILTKEDRDNWIALLDGMNPDGEPSMRQDMKAKRLTEVELFSGTILRLGKKYNVETPVNRYLYDRIKEMEKQF